MKKKRVFWLQPISSGTRNGRQGSGEDTRRIEKWEKLLREASELQEEWNSFLESSHHHSYQR